MNSSSNAWTNTQTGRPPRRHRAKVAGAAIAVLSMWPAVVASTSVSATPPGVVVTLRVGTDDVPGRPAADQIQEFARAVAERGDGSIVVEPAWHAAGDTANWDQHVARLVTSGELEMGLIPSRAWDTEGVT